MCPATTTPNTRPALGSCPAHVVFRMARFDGTVCVPPTSSPIIPKQKRTTASCGAIPRTPTTRRLSRQTPNPTAQTHPHRHGPSRGVVGVDVAPRSGPRTGVRRRGLVLPLNDVALREGSIDSTAAGIVQHDRIDPWTKGPTSGRRLRGAIGESNPPIWVALDRGVGGRFVGGAVFPVPSSLMRRAAGKSRPLRIWTDRHPTPRRQPTFLTSLQSQAPQMTHNHLSHILRLHRPRSPAGTEPALHSTFDRTRARREEEQGASKQQRPQAAATRSLHSQQPWVQTSESSSC